MSNTVNEAAQLELAQALEQGKELAQVAAMSFVNAYEALMTKHSA